MGNYNAGLTDVGANATPLSAYRFAGVGADVTLTGYFTDLNSRQCSPLITVAIPTADGSAVATFFDGIDPATDPYEFSANAVGFVGALSGDMYVGTGGDDAGSLRSVAGTDEPDTGYPVALAGDYLLFGRVF